MKLTRVITLSTLLALGACGGDKAPQSETGADSGDTAATAMPLNDPFTIGIRQVGEIFDPTSVLPAEISVVAFNMYDWLFDRDHEGNVKPGLAESWELSPDARELVVTLRKGVTFHNGDPLSAEDVVFSWHRLQKSGFGVRVARSMKTIEAVDEHTVRFEFAQPEIGFVPFGGFAVLSKSYHEKVGEKQFKEQPIGSGPYQFEKLARGQYIDLSRYDNYWGGKPEIDNVRFQFVTEDTTRVAQLQTGEVDMIMQVPFPLVPQVESAQGLKTEVLSPGGMTVFLALKTDNPDTPWADRRVREAIALAIDHEAIVNDILLGYPTHHPLLAPDDLGYDPSLEPYGYDPERAKALLKEAGVEDLGFELFYIAGATTGIKETAEAVALYLNRVGIKAVAKPIQGPQFIGWVQQASKNPEMDYVAMFIGGVAGRTEPSLGLVTHFSHITPFAWYVDPKINGLALKMAGTADREQRGEAIKALGKMVHADMRYIPLWTNSLIYAMKNCIDYEPTLGEYDLLMLRDVSIERCQKQP